MSKFKVGDVVEANELSNGQYAFTTKLLGWVGKVVEIDEDGDFTAVTIKGDGSDVGFKYSSLVSDYFDLPKPSKKQRIATLENEVADLKERLEALENWRSA